MSLSTPDGLDWFRQAGIKLTPEQEAQAIAYRKEQQEKAGREFDQKHPGFHAESVIS